MWTSTSGLFSVKAKVALVSTSVLTAAIMLTTSDIAVYAPWIYNGVVSWLQPPYLYLVVNCIIITIVASSKLQPPSDDASPPPLSSIPAAHQPAAEISRSDFLNLAAEYNYEGGDEKGSESDEIDSRGGSGDDESEFSPPPIVDETSNKENECVEAAKSAWTAAENGDATRFERPPTSARFGHRRILKASPEGGRAVLGVSKPKKQDTLENTWKAITEGRAIPMSRHLKKSDTWECERSSQENTPPAPQMKTMRKAETFNDRSNNNNGGSGGQGKLRKEPSLSQDELNRRVEAFIKKFNEDMRLQRQESLNQYSEMVRR